VGIKSLHIDNFKSLVDFHLELPGNFVAFVGPNAAGKSNIFEALEFLTHVFLFGLDTASNNFGTAKRYLNFNLQDKLQRGLSGDCEATLKIESHLGELGGVIRFLPTEDNFQPSTYGRNFFWSLPEEDTRDRIEEIRAAETRFAKSFTRLFIGREDLVKFKADGSERLRIDGANLEAVLWRLLQREVVREELIDWLQTLVPGLEKVEVRQSELSGQYYLQLYEHGLARPLDKHLISDGTYNLLCLLAAVYQSDEPQFLCIEEPENGLNPYVIKTLTEFFRSVCEEKGHVIWLNTHSATLVKALQPREIVLVDKVEGITRAQTLPSDIDLHGLDLDEAWLSNALGGGLPW